MDNWDEIRTAYQVARMGTVSGAADRLGVHHATVIRHIDALEGRLGVKLFQRHARGYTATEAGQDLLRVAQTTEDQFAQLEGRIKGRGADVSGDLVVTSLVAFAPLMVAALTSFREKYPDVIVRFLTGDRVFRLEYGEAHVALRAGAAPQEPDNVVQPFASQQIALYATRGYIERRGMPEDIDALRAHDFVSHDDMDTRAPFLRWLHGHVDASRIVFRSPDTRVMEAAVLAGAGIGFFSTREAAMHPDLVQVMPPRDEWLSPLWLVTHVDLHRTAKVQAFIKHLKAFAAEEDGA
ncbi:LysR family transcriptional regulator [Tropicibacter naphthalenivorans]|uniref:D-malate degradation protein R n=1 Tax=Tropicibacter naphthalenivorans TaxID=441103 RepID=A0A0P1FZV8_9RHOB|nr:LysR family transcriptional regulator [Tropicibacter naphthalenivorans]CUH74827.1 D-malate degradation protein R [Tropicibacter naphthalenivorans]SMC48729.1 DNA-binding transcriptional regulator, LysR family [Tropicibacter naphthalenivorans]